MTEASSPGDQDDAEPQGDGAGSESESARWSLQSDGSSTQQRIDWQRANTDRRIRTRDALRELDLTKRDLVCAVRAVFSDGRARTRASARWEIAEELGIGVGGPAERQVLKAGLNVGIRRKVITRSADELVIDCRHISDYDRADLIAALRAATKRQWTDRDEAIRGAARHLGFRRTGKNITEQFKSAINGGIRRGELEKDRNWIRST